MPILLSAVLVFVASSLIHMCLQIHKGDYQKLPNEDAALDALRKAGVGPGQFMFPHCSSMKEATSPAMKEKFTRGPTGTLVVRGGDCMNMGKALGQWFAFCLVVSVITAYVTGLARGPGGGDIFRISATIALLGYGFSSVCDSIWKGISWSTTAKFLFDGLVYALCTAWMFRSFWPAAA